jgi:maltooligosyltrehalose trehalohydrolase
MASPKATAHEIAFERELGAVVVDGGVIFTVWAPRHHSLSVVLDSSGDFAMERLPGGYFKCKVPDAIAGQRYWFRLPHGLRPDPVSRFQPDGPLGPSMVVDPRAFSWTDHDWPGTVPPHRQVVYELHVGTFTKAGTWAAARERLPQLADLGVTTLEIMPIAEFAGRFGWGYDGVLLFAPFHGYGEPDDARRFVDAAHSHGLGVILDVVYNHLGPVGNILPEFSETYFAEHETVWGRGFNLDRPDAAPVRQYMRANVRHWLQEYHFDGLRFDATHAIVDGSPRNIIDELARCGRDARAPRRVYMVAESESQDVARLMTDETDGHGVDSLWNEDWHHSSFVALTGRREAYFTDYTGTAHEFAAIARWNLLYQGQWYSWQKKGRGTDARHFPRSAFVCFLENHDQVANTGFGTRLYNSVDRALWRTMSALLLLGPATPLLFQGVERGASEPFTYFADHDEALADAVRTGRLELLAHFPSLRDPDVRDRIPSPEDESAFRACQLGWHETEDGAHAWSLHIDLLALRRTDPVLSRLGTSEVQVESSASTATLLVLRYEAALGERLLLFNFGQREELLMNDPLFAPPRGSGWEVVWSSERIKYGGRGIEESFGPGQWILQARCAWLLEAHSRDAVSR